MHILREFDNYEMTFHPHNIHKLHKLTIKNYFYQHCYIYKFRFSSTVTKIVLRLC